MNRAAIVIGVNKPGNLDALSAAQASANDFADWLEKEGFPPVQRFIDTEQQDGTRAAVEAGAIRKAIRTLAKAGNLDQLIVYFSGHGFFVGGSELWLLSGAPQDPAEAVNLPKSIRLAGRSGIGHIVIVSDACRSVPRTLDGELTDGGSIFDNPATAPGRRTVVEVFYASALGDPSLELKVEEAVRKYDAVFTEEFLKVFEDVTPAQLVQSVPFDGGTAMVVPNGLLEEYLREIVPEVVEKRTKAKRTQAPEGDIKFRQPPTWIGRAKIDTAAGTGLPTQPSGGAPPSDLSQLDIDNLFTAGIFEALSGKPTGTLSGAGGKVTARTKAFMAAQKIVGEAQGRRVEQFESRTGFNVVGTRVLDAAGLGIDVEFLKGWSPHGGDCVRLWPRENVPGSVLIRFEDGSGSVVAGLPGFIGAVTIESGRVIDVSYLPSRGSEPYARMSNPERQIKQAQRLHALAAAAALAGTLHRGRKEARDLGDLVRYEKAVDPTLGVYASYIYGEGGISDEVLDILKIMQKDFSFQLFDVAMLAGALAKMTPAKQAAARVVPFCPMLQRGWLHLGILESNIPKAASAATRYLKPALWTMFEREGMDILFDAVRSAKNGRLT